MYHGFSIEDAKDRSGPARGVSGSEAGGESEEAATGDSYCDRRPLSVSERTWSMNAPKVDHGHILPIQELRLYDEAVSVVRRVGNEEPAIPLSQR